MGTIQQGAAILRWSRPSSGHESKFAGDADGVAIARLQAGDASAFDLLFERYSDYVYNIVYGIVGKADEARDVTQEVFLQAYRSIGSFRGNSRFGTWLYRIAVNRAVDEARRQTRRRWLPFQETLASAPEPDSDPAERAEKDLSRDLVQRVLQTVPARHRDVLVLRYYQELSMEEIAEVLGCSVTAAKVRLHRARLQFRQKYEELHG
jgi:RNA polymerase sigma-70 factor (ECF subfamily)